MTSLYYHKYLKYKNKYIDLKNQYDNYNLNTNLENKHYTSKLYPNANSSI